MEGPTGSVMVPSLDSHVTDHVLSPRPSGLTQARHVCVRAQNPEENEGIAVWPSVSGDSLLSLFSMSTYAQ